MVDVRQQRRVFFALWPGPRVRQQISCCLAQLAVTGRRIPPANYHLTLHFLGNTPVDTLDCYQRAATGLAFAGFTLRCDKFGLFPKPGLLWLGCTRLPESLLALVEGLGQRLQQCGYQADSRPFTPHVSLYRKVARSAGSGRGFRLPAVSPVIDWKVEGFSLLESVAIDRGVCYRPLQTWPLA